MDVSHRMGRYLLTCALLTLGASTSVAQVRGKTQDRSSYQSPTLESVPVDSIADRIQLEVDEPQRRPQRELVDVGLEPARKPRHRTAS